MNDQFLKDANYFLTSLTSAFTIFASWQTFKHSYAIHQRKRQIKQLDGKDLLEVSELVGRGSEIKDLVLLKGEVETKDGKEMNLVLQKKGWTTGQKKQKLAIHLSFTEAMYSNDAMDVSKDNYHLNIQDALKHGTIAGSSRIVLTDGKSKIHLKNFDQKNYAKVMEILKWEEDKHRLEFSQLIYSFFLGVLKALVMVGSYGKEQAPYLRGVETGKRTIQAGIKIGASISVLGTVGVNTQGELFLDAQSIFKDRLSEMTELRTEIEEIIKTRNIWFLGSVLGSIYLGRRAFKYCKKNGIRIPYILDGQQQKEDHPPLVEMQQA